MQPHPVLSTSFSIFNSHRKKLLQHYPINSVFLPILKSHPKKLLQPHSILSIFLPILKSHLEKVLQPYQVLAIPLLILISHYKKMYQTALSNSFDILNLNGQDNISILEYITEELEKNNTVKNDSEVQNNT